MQMEPSPEMVPGVEGVVLLATVMTSVLLDERELLHPALARLVMVSVVLPALLRLEVVNVPEPAVVTVMVAVLPVELLGALRL